MNKIYKIKGFIPFILVGFINAFVDLGHLVITLGIISRAFQDGAELAYITLASALFIIPSIIVFSPAGFLSDKFPKNEILKYGALCNIPIFILLTLCYFGGAFWLAMSLSLVLGIQSAFFAPAKYGYIKELVGRGYLTWGNGIVQASVIVAMLLSLALFSSFIKQLPVGLSDPNLLLKELGFVGIILCGFVILESILSFLLPTLTKTRTPSLRLALYLKGRLLKRNIKLLGKHRMVFLSILFVALFWSITQLLVYIFPIYLKNLAALESPIGILLAATGLGIVLGCTIAGRYSKNYIETGLIPLGAGLMFLAILSVTYFHSLLLLSFIVFLFGLGGALYIVPLQALMQFYTNDKELGRVLVGSKVVQNLGLLLSLAVASLWAFLEWNPKLLFYLASTLSLGVLIYTLKLLPFSLVRILISMALLQRYKLIVEGFDNLPRKGGVLLLGNHISFIDWAIVQMALPKRVYFVMERSIYSRWYVRLFIDFFGVIPVSDAASEASIEKIQARLKAGDMVCFFPEGVISRHGHLNEFKDGFEAIAKGVDSKEAVILPFYIRGLWGSIFSRSNEQFRERKRSFTKRSVSIAFGPPLDIHTPRDRIKSKIFEMSFKAWEHQCKNSPTLAGGFIESCKRGGGDIAVIDTQTGSMSYRRLLTICLMLSQDMKEMKFKPLPQKTSYCSLTNDCIGVLLPSSIAALICNFASVLAGKIVVNLNFTNGAAATLAALEATNILHIYTSRKFLERLKDKGIEFDFSGYEVHYMEDLVASIRKQKIGFIVNLTLISLLPTWLLKLLFAKDSTIDSTCAILFSSGSEGRPKGVMLSHLNIMSNIAQIADVIHAKHDECILASLPPFHAFGLTVTTFMPIIENMLMITHADPTDALGVAKAIAQNKVTIMCATSTLLGIYARNPKLDRVMFDSIRLTVAGAEKLKSDIRDAYTMKFNKPIYEGYGATETTPVASVNLPDEFDVTHWRVHRANKEGSVGMPLPGTAIRIVDPDSLEQLPTGEQGLILIGGHQIMQGYLNDPNKSEDVLISLGGIRWYKSGDKGYLDSDGFLHITDRYSRFVKIGGEMISLSSLEEDIARELKLRNIATDTKLCTAGVEDAKKGEKIVLLIESNEATQQIIKAIKDSDIRPIRKPSLYFEVDSLPMLGSGKMDLKGVKALADSLSQGS